MPRRHDALAALVLALASTYACFYFMWPRLLDAHFGLLDDGVIVAASRSILQTPSQAFSIGVESGRFMPGFWLYHAAVYAVAGPRPAGFFAAQLLVLSIIVVVTGLAVKRSTGSLALACVTSALVLAGGPVTEAFYTLSKQEPTQTLCFVLGVYAALHAGAPDRLRWPAALVSMACLVAASLLKETTVVLLPIVLGWSAVAWLRGTWAQADRRRMLLVLLAGAAMALSLFFITRAAVLPAMSVSGGYGAKYQLTPTRLAVSAMRWAGWLLHDYPHLFLLAPVVLLRIRAASERERELLAASAIWMAGWIAIYLPWQSLQQYYLLPFSVGAAVFLATSFFVLTRDVWTRRSPLAAATVLGASALVACTMLNGISEGGIQLTVDRSNAQLIDLLAELPPSSTVYVNIPEPNEYEFEIGMHLHELRQRPDVSVEYFGRRAVEAGNAGPRFVATPFVRNQPAPSARLALWQGLTESGASALREAAPTFELRGRVRNSTHLFDVGFHRILRWFLPRVGHHLDWGIERGFVDRRVYFYGWDLVQLPGH